MLLHLFFFQHGDTALHYAILSGNLELFKVLIEEYGADPTVRNEVS